MTISLSPTPKLSPCLSSERLPRDVIFGVIAGLQKVYPHFSVMPDGLVHESEKKYRAHFFAHVDPLSDWTISGSTLATCPLKLFCPPLLLARLWRRRWSRLHYVYWTRMPSAKLVLGACIPMRPSTVELANSSWVQFSSCAVNSTCTAVWLRQDGDGRPASRRADQIDCGGDQVDTGRQHIDDVQLTTMSVQWWGRHQVRHRELVRRHGDRMRVGADNGRYVRCADLHVCCTHSDIAVDVGGDFCNGNLLLQLSLNTHRTP